MRALPTLLLPALLLAAPLRAQGPVLSPGPASGGPAATVTVVTAGEPRGERPLAAPVALSALLPGSGERYLGSNARARGFLAAEAVLWASLWWSANSRDRALSTAHAYAVRHAGASASAKGKAKLLQAMADYRSRSGVASLSSSPEFNDDYDQDRIRAGESPEEAWPADDAHSWDWGSSESEENDAHWRHYKRLMGDYRANRIAFQAIVGALVLNRLLSVVDVLQLRRAGAGGPSAAIVPSGAGTGADLIVDF